MVRLYKAVLGYTSLLLLGMCTATAQEYNMRYPGWTNNAAAGITYAPAVSETIKEDDASITSWFRDYRGLKQLSWKMQSAGTDAAGNRHYRYQQYYKGLPVDMGMLCAHYRAGRLYAVNGMYFADPAVDPGSSRISPVQAVAAALQLWPSARYAWQDKLQEQMLQLVSGRDTSYYPRAVLCLLPDPLTAGRLRLVYRCDIYSLQPLYRKRCYLDATDGSLVIATDMICTIDRPGIAHTHYSGTRSITCDSAAPGLFYLTETGRGGGIATYNAEKGFGITSTRFEDDNNNWDNRNADQDDVATDIHWGMEAAYDFYKTVFSRNSYDNKDSRIIAMAHTEVKSNNAHWDGTAAFFGDGDSISYYPLASPDICVHEFTHGVTMSTANLTYMDEMGALSESFSDILGKCAEHFVRPAAFTWGMGEQVHIGPNPIRDMRDPHNTFQPAYYQGMNYYLGHSDYGGVHTNSQVQNHWFYLLCEGGTGIREGDGAAFSVTGIGIEKAQQIAYSTLTDYLFPLAQYKDAAKYSLLAAQSLYGASSPESAAAAEAWYAVGLADKTVSAIAEVQEASPYAVYPNPASGSVQVRLPANEFNANLQLLDLYGRVIWRQQAVRYPGCTLDISTAAPGIYILEAAGAAGNCRIKLVRR